MDLQARRKTGHGRMRQMLQVALVGLGLAATTAPAAAHPHIFVDAKAAIVFDPTGAVAAIRHSWTFDKEFSAWSVQGLDTNNDGIVSTPEMQDLANDDMDGLGQYEYYTYAGEGSFDLTFTKGSDATLKYTDGQTTLEFVTAVYPPYRIQKRLELAINDPEYYVAITFAGLGAVTLENAPNGCAVALDPPRELDPTLQDELYALPPDVTKLPPGLAQAMKGVQGAIIVTCPPTGTVVAAPGVAPTKREVKTVPFKGPAPAAATAHKAKLLDSVPGGVALRSAVLPALALIPDQNLVWLLIGFGLFFGLWRVAGYGRAGRLLAQYRRASLNVILRSILLSFVALTMQALVAVMIALAAIGLLRVLAPVIKSADAMAIGLYALVALLGAILMLRSMVPLIRSRTALHDAYIRGVLIPSQLAATQTEQLRSMFSASLKPSLIALVLLALAMSENLLLVGLLAVVAMSLSSGLTIAVLAGTARLTRNADGSAVVVRSGSPSWLQVLGGAAVLCTGVVLLLLRL